MKKSEFLEKYSLVELKESDNLVIDIKYATAENFTNEVLYSEPICFLRESTAKKLLAANEELNKNGYKLKVWDAFRPIEYQRKMWKVCPDENFVANPEKDNCNHCKGNAVDVTLCNLNDEEVAMPTEFDHFGIESYRNYYDNLANDVKKNAILLETTMQKHGFIAFPSEWWHFNDSDNYDIIRDIYED